MTDDERTAYHAQLRKGSAMTDARPSVLYHATTPKKARLYSESGKINAPVRGFDTPAAALAWALKIGRTVILRLEVDASRVHKLPDHHNKYGFAWWVDADCCAWTGEFHADKGIP